jgi:hypothetical protein
MTLSANRNLKELVLRALTLLLILAGLGGLYFAAFYYWLSFGPPTPEPKEFYKIRAWLALAVAVCFFLWAAIVIWRQRRGKHERAS